jgi:hypothetical protein
MGTLNRRLLVLEALESKDEIVGFCFCSYEEWPDPLPDDWVETFPGSQMWLTPLLETPHDNA